MVRLPREEHRQKTDQEYADDLEAFVGKSGCTVLVDPSAASFIAELKSRGIFVIGANNDVLDGIRKTSTLMRRRQIQIHRRCEGLQNELGAYRWDEKASQRGEEKPVKEQDHGPDALRYYINSLPRNQRHYQCVWSSSEFGLSRALGIDGVNVVLQ